MEDLNWINSHVDSGNDLLNNPCKFDGAVEVLVVGWLLGVVAFWEEEAADPREVYWKCTDVCTYLCWVFLQQMVISKISYRYNQVDSYTVHNIEAFQCGIIIQNFARKN